MADFKPVLYADDDENDLFLMERAFTKTQIVNPLRTVNDGSQAIAYLAGTAPFQDRSAHPLPCLVLLDLSMPGKHGLEVLKWLRSEPTLAGLPVVVLSSSNQESDIHRAYLLGADGYLIKPGGATELVHFVETLKNYWLAEKRPAEKFIDFAAEISARVPKTLAN